MYWAVSIAIDVGLIRPDEFEWNVNSSHFHSPNVWEHSDNETRTSDPVKQYEIRINAI